MRYMIDDRVLARFLMELRPDYIEVRAVSEAQQFLATHGRAVRFIDTVDQPDRRTPMEHQIRLEHARQDSCQHIWEQPIGHRNSTCRLCGAIDVSDSQ